MSAGCDPTAESLAGLEQAKLDAMKELAYGASHEINNPLANISARAQTLLRDEVDPERRRALEAILHQAHRAHEMISDLMLFARPPRLNPGPVDVSRLLSVVQSELASDCRRRDVELHVAVDGAPSLQADANQLAVAIKALCVNSLEAIGHGGRIDVEASAIAAGENPGNSEPGVQLTVRDDGPGIAADVRPHMFDPFFSGREAGRGLGFGLSKCWRIVTAHGGRILAENGAERGAVFTICLPLSARNGSAS